MNCVNCDAYREDLQTGAEYCKELGALVSSDVVICPRQQAGESFREHIIDRFTKVEKE